MPRRAHVISREALNKIATRRSSRVSLGAFLEVGGLRLTLDDESGWAQLAASGLGCKYWLLSFAIHSCSTSGSEGQQWPSGSASERVSNNIRDERKGFKAVRHRAEWGTERMEHQASAPSIGEAQGPGRCFTGEATSDSNGISSSELVSLLEAR